MNKKNPFKRCWHLPGPWQPIEPRDRDKHITAAMYRHGVAPTHIRTCRCGSYVELKVAKWEDGER